MNWGTSPFVNPIQPVSLANVSATGTSLGSVTYSVTGGTVSTLSLHLLDDTFESRPIEIYSTDQYGRPSGSITSIDFCPTPTNTCVYIIDLDLSQATEITYLGVRCLGITSLDITSNVLLQNIFFLNLSPSM
jgi:hypothetical protein